MNRTLALLLMASVIVVALCYTLFFAVKNAHDAARELSCHNNIKQIGFALLNHDASFRHLPLAVETKDGALWRSWRTHIYPTFIEQMEAMYGLL